MIDLDPPILFYPPIRDFLYSLYHLDTLFYLDSTTYLYATIILDYHCGYLVRFPIS